MRFDGDHSQRRKPADLLNRQRAGLRHRSTQPVERGPKLRRKALQSDHRWRHEPTLCHREHWDVEPFRNQRDNYYA